MYANKDNNLTIRNIEDFLNEDLPSINYTKLSYDQAMKIEGLIIEAELLGVLKKKQEQ